VEEPADSAGRMIDATRRYRSIAGRTVLFDDEGFLWDPSDWNEEVAEAMAREVGLELFGESHRKVIGYLREFFAFNGRAPLNRQLKGGTGLSLLELEALFPGGIKLGARRIAGLPNPKNCA
jgi:dissimilatory sulfite reductase related protein